MPYNDIDTLLDVVAALQSRVERLERAPRNIASSVDSGGFSVIDPATGHVIFYSGNTDIPDGSGRTQMSTTFRRDDNTVALEIRDTGPVLGHTHQQAIQWYDRNGRIVFADDTTSGSGIALPYIPVGPFVDVLTAPTATTTSGTFTTIQTCQGYKMHPKISVVLLVQSSDGTTTGEVKFLDGGGTQLGTTIPVGAGAFAFVSQTFTMTGDFKERIEIDVQARVTGGTGSIGVRGVMAVGIQS